jgi:predicted dehydrogenase
MKRKINWGIIGLGGIANTFAQDLSLVDDANLLAVASRNINKAKTFAEKHNADRYYDSYEKIALDPEIDIIYIATPHVFHFENTMMCLEAGKSVLCEKPMGMNSDQVQKMITKAKEKGLFLMEAIWTRFIPSTETMLNLIESGVIGKVQFVRADFGFKGDRNPEKRLFNKNLGGGSLLDIGIYPIYLSLLTMGIPNDIKAVARMSKTGVDSFCGMLFDYADGAKAVLDCTFDADTPTEAYIHGEIGSIKMHSRFHHSQRLTITQHEKTNQEIDIPYAGNGYYHEIMEVQKCLIERRMESRKMSYSTSLKLVNILDQVRKEIGLSY